MSTYTPWGPAQDARHICRGIVSYSTAGHGGLHVSPGMLATFPWPFTPGLLAQVTWTNGTAWFEEDCDWCLPVCARPDLPWPKGWIRHAFPTLERWHPALYGLAFPNWEGYP